MPREFLYHIAHLDAFMFPFVRSTIDRIGPPAALRTIPSPFREELLATLALELTSISVYVLRRNAHAEVINDIGKILLEVHGGPRYFRLRSELNQLGSQTWENIRNFRELARDAYNFSDAGREKIDNTVIAQGPYQRNVRWRYDCFDSRDIDRVRRGLKAAKKKEIRLAQLSAVKEQEFNAYAQTIRDLKVYRSDYAEMKKKHSGLNFGRAVDAQCDGAAFFLRNTDYSWWTDFTTHFEKNVIGCISRAPHKIALREPGVMYKITQSEKKYKDWDEAAAAYFASGEDEWCVEPVTRKTINGMRGRLRAQDKASMAWLDKNGSVSNFYIRRSAALVAEKSKSVITSPRKPRLDCDKILLNQLSWCLSRLHEHQYPFKPLTSLSLSLEDWETHRKKWWAKVEKVRMGMD